MQKDPCRMVNLVGRANRQVFEEAKMGLGNSPKMKWKMFGIMASSILFGRRLVNADPHPGAVGYFGWAGAGGISSCDDPAGLDWMVYLFS